MDKNMEVVETVTAEVVDENSIIQLRKPMADGATTLTLDFNKLDGNMLIRCELNAKKLDRGMTVPVLSQVYLAQVAAAAAGVRYDDILRLSAPDFNAATLRTQNFLMDSRG